MILKLPTSSRNKMDRSMFTLKVMLTHALKNSEYTKVGLIQQTDL